MSSQIDLNNDLNRRIEADPAKFFEIHDINGSKLISNDSLTNGKNEKTVVKENNQNSFNKENKENEIKSKKESKHKKSRSKRRSESSRSNHKSSRKRRSSSSSREMSVSKKDRKEKKERKKEKKHKKRNSRSRSLRKKRSRSDSSSSESKSRSRERNRESEKEKRIRVREKERERETKDYLEKRKRQRSNSRSAYIDMKLRNTENGSGFYQRFYERPHEDNDPNKPQLFWDGFQWVVRGTTTNIQTFDLNTKPGRKVQIANIPLQLNLSVKDLKEFIYEELIKQNYIDKKEKNIIKAVDLDYKNNAGVFVLESIDYAKRVTLLDGVKLLGFTLRISTYNELPASKSGSSTATNSTIGGSLALANTAHLSAKSAAIAFAAIQSLGKNDQQISLNKDNNAASASNLMSSRIIKVMNVVDQKDIDKYKEEKFDEVEADMREEFDRYGDLKSVMIIKPKMRKIGAETGAVFVEFEKLNQAEFCMKNMKGRRYDGREIKCAFIDEEVYTKELMLKREDPLVENRDKSEHSAKNSGK